MKKLDPFAVFQQNLMDKRPAPSVVGWAPRATQSTMRLSTASNLIENGMVYIPESASWLDGYLHELTTFPNGKFDDQAARECPQVGREDD